MTFRRTIVRWSVYNLDSKDSFQQPQDVDEVDEGELSEISRDVYADGTNPKYATTERIFRLLHLLTANDCMRQDIFERLNATLPDEQKREFNRWARKPYVYFNQETVTDYLPHRVTINTVVDAISKRQQIGFEYTSMQGTMPHEHVDPYYIVHQDGHL